MIPILFSFIRIFFIVHYVVTRKCYHLCQLLRVSKFSCNWLHRGTNPLFGCYHPVCDSYAQPHSCVQASAESSITLLLVNLLIETQVIPEHITMSVHRTFLCIFHRCMALIRRQQTAYPSGRSAVTFMYPVYGRKDRVSEHKNNILFIQFSRFNMLYYTMI